MVIHRGRSVAQAPLARLMAQRNGGVRVAGPDVGGLADRLRADGATITPEASGAIVVHDRPGEDVGRAVAAGAFVISELAPLGSSLEEIFFELTRDEEAS